MKLSDVMSAMNLSHYAQVALVLFVVAFVAVVGSLFSASERETWERARQLPLRDDEPAPTPEHAHSSTRGGR